MTKADNFDQRVREALMGAALILRNGRWIRDWYEAPTKPSHLQRDGYCVMGAIRKSVGGDAVSGYNVSHPLPSEQEKVVQAAAEKLQIVLGPETAPDLTEEQLEEVYGKLPKGAYAIESNIRWNDHDVKGTSKTGGAKIVEALEKAAKL